MGRRGAGVEGWLVGCSKEEGGRNAGCDGGEGRVKRGGKRTGIVLSVQVRMHLDRVL